MGCVATTIFDSIKKKKVLENSFSLDMKFRMLVR